MDDMDVVLAVLRAAPGKMSPEAIASAAGLGNAAVDRALQSLLLRRLVSCESHERPGRGGQHARFIGEDRLPLWRAVLDRSG